MDFPLSEPARCFHRLVLQVRRGKCTEIRFSGLPSEALIPTATTNHRNGADLIAKLRTRQAQSSCLRPASWQGWDHESMNGTDRMQILIKLLSLGASLGAGALARKGLDAAWRKSTGHALPRETGNLNNPLPGVLIFAVATALTGAAIQGLTQSAAKKTALKLQRNAN